MNLKTIVLVPFITFAAMMVLNGLFHAVIAAPFFDRAFSSFGSAVRPIKETNPGLLAIVEATWVITLFYLLTINSRGRMRLKNAIIGGMLMNASICGTWNLINASMFSVYPREVILPDMAWHVLAIGPIAGYLVATLYNKLSGAGKLKPVGDMR